MIAAATAAVLKIGSDELQHLMPHFAIGFASLALVLVASLFARRKEPRRWVRRLSLVVLIAVIIQGILGGTRVTQVSLPLAIIHGCFAQAFFCLAVFMVVVTSRWWITAPICPIPPALNFAANSSLWPSPPLRWFICN